MKGIKKAFTFVELMIVVTILTILGAVGFSSYIDSIADTRDSQRTADLLKLSSGLEVFEQKRGQYPYPGDFYNITYDGNIVAYQGYFNNNVHISTFDTTPKDPKIETPYIISTTVNRLEFEVAGTLENGGKPIASLHGKYKSVSKNVLPRIVLAKKGDYGDSFEIKDGVGDGSENRKLFVYDKQRHNLVYDFVEPYEPYSDGTDFDTLLAKVESAGNFSQNNDYRNCTEIQEGGKLIIPLSATPFEYQALTETGSLQNINCTQ